MPNPEYLVTDSDCLIQVLIARQGRLLADLRNCYQVTAAVVPEVEVEVCHHRKFGKRFEAGFQGLVTGGNVTILDEDALRDVLSRRGISTAQANEEIAAYDLRGRRYASMTGSGEGYSHAAAVQFRLPIASHDGNALKALQVAAESTGVPVLRFADLLAFGLEVGRVAADECRHAIGTLKGMHEFVPYPVRDVPKESIPASLRGMGARLRIWNSQGDPPAPKGPRDVLYLVEP